MADENAADLHVALDTAACNFDVEQCRALLGQGADPKHVFRTNANAWYDGDTTSTLYRAVEAFKRLDSNQHEETEECYVDLVELLLQAGAKANFCARRGNWNRSTEYPLMDAATKTLGQLSSAELKKRFLQAFTAAGAELNARSVRGKQGNFSAFGSVSYSLFDVVKKLTPGSDLSLLEVYIDAGVRVNCSESSYSVTFDDEGEDYDEDGEEEFKAPKNHQTLLHAAIQTGNAELVALLVTRGGADVNQNMVSTTRQHYVLTSCLQLAQKKGYTDVVEVLTAAGAHEVVRAALSEPVQCFYRFGNWTARVTNYADLDPNTVIS